MTNSKLNLGLIFFLFVLFTGMTYAASVTECGNLTGSGTHALFETYFLENDINIGSGGSEILAGEPLEYCFMINGSYVELDCQGHTINTNVDIGVLVYNDDGDLLTTQTGIRINNCTIKNTEFGGIYTYEAEEVFITNNTIEDNGRTELRGDLLSCTGGINILRGEPDEPYYNFIAYNTLVNNTMGICLNGRNTGGVQNTIIRNNTISGSSAAGLVLVEGTRSNEIYNTTIFNNSYGIFISDAPFNDFEDLNVSNNKYADIMGDPVFEEDGFCTNDFENVIVTGGNNLLVVDNPDMVINPTLLEGMGIFDGVIPTTELIICNDNITIEDVYMQGDPTYRNNGLFIMGEGRAYNITINNLTATNLMAGVYAQLARNITIQNSTFENNQYGIIFNSVKKGDFSHNTFNENTASGIFGTTSPAYYFYFSSLFEPEYFYQVSDLSINNNEFTNTGYGPSMREAFPTMSNVPGGFITHFVDMGTGSAIQLLLTKNVTISENTINNASTYGIYAFYTSEMNLTDNTITLVNNVTEFDPYRLDFGEPPEHEPMVNQLKDMLNSMPGTGIYLDGANMITLENIISNNVKGLVSSPVSYVVDTLLTTEFLPELKNYIINNEFTGSNIGLYLAGNFGDVVYHNKFMDYNYGVQVLSANNVVVDNMFNTTDYFLTVDESYLNTYNATEITEESFLIPYDRNILSGLNTGGNYWGLTNGEGHSDTCDDFNEDGFCDDIFELNGTNNTDYKPLAFFSVIDCVDDFECWLSVDFGDGFFCNIETECEECDPACDEDQQCVYDPGLDEGVCTDIVQECIDLNDVISLGEVNNEYGHVTDYNNVLYINNDTTICYDVYTTTRTGVYMYMNGSYSLDGSNSRFISSSSGDLIGILNYNDGVTIKNCMFSGFTDGVVSTPNPATTPLDYSVGVNLFNSVIEFDEETSVYVEDPIESVFDDVSFNNLYVDNAVKVGNNLFFTSFWYKNSFYDLSDFSETYQSEENDDSKYYYNKILPLYDDCAVIITNITHMSMVSCDGTDLGNDLWGGSPGIDNPGNTIIELIQNPNNGYVYRYDSYLDYTGDSTYKANIVYFKTDLSEFGNYEFEGLTGLFIPTLTIDQDDNVIVMFKNDSASYLYKFNETLSLLDNTTLSAHNPYTKSIFSGYENDFIYELSTNNSALSVNESILKLQRYTFEGTIDITEDISLVDFSDYTVQAFGMSGDGTTLLLAGHSKSVNNEGRKIYISNDSGENWFETGPGGVDSIYWQTAYVSYDGQYILIGTNSYDLYLSKDKGLTWEETASDTFTAEQWFALHVSDDGQLMYAKYSDGPTSGYNLTRSTDGGSTWENIIITNDRNLSTYLENGNILFANDGQTILLSKYGNDDVYYSTDNGTTFHNLTSIPALAVDQNWMTSSISEDGENIILGYYDAAAGAGRIYLSNDSGATFTEIVDDASGDPLEAPWSHSSISEDGQYIIIAASGVPGKAYFSSDYGARWNSVSLPYAAAQVLGVFVAADEDLFYIFGMNGMDDYIYIFNPAGSIEETLREDVAMGSTNVIFSDDATKFIFKQVSPLIGIIGDLSLLERQGPITEEYTVPRIYSGVSDASRNMNFLFDGEYFYYVANDIRAGNERLYYKVFNLTLDEVATGEFKPSSGEVEFAAYLNNETGNLEFVGTFNTHITYFYHITNFYAYLDKDNEFEFNLVYPSEDYPFELQYYEGEFVEVDSVGNSVVVGVNKTSRVSTVNVRVFDSEGNLTSNNDYTMDETTYSVPHDFIIDSEGNYVIAGKYFNSTTYLYTYFMMFINSTNGELIDTEIYDGNIYDGYNLVFIGETPSTYVLFTENNVGTSNMYNINKTNYALLSSSAIGGKMYSLDYNDEYLVSLVIYGGVLKGNMVNVSNSSQIFWSGDVSYNNINYVNVYVDSQGFVYYTDTWWDGDGVHSSIFIYDQLGNLHMDMSNMPRETGKIEFDENNNVYMWYDGDSSGISYMESGVLDGDADPFIITDGSIVTFSYNNGTITTLDYNDIYINETSVYRDLIKNYNVNEDEATLVWSYDYLEEYFDGSLVSYDSILIGITPIDSNYYVGALINVVLDPFTNSMLDSSVDFYKVTMDGEVTKWFDFDESLTYPSYMEYINGKLYVIMGYSENFEMADSSTFFSGRYYLYEFDSNGDYEIIPIPEYYSLATPTMFKAPVAYDPSGYMIIAGSPLGPEVDMGGTVINLLPALNLTKVKLSTREVMWNKQISDPSSIMLNWGRTVEFVDDGYLTTYSTINGGTGEPESVIVKTDLNGDILWNQTILNGSDENLCNWEDLEMDVGKGNGFAVSSEYIYTINYTEGIGFKLLKSNDNGESWTNIFSEIDSIDAVDVSIAGSNVLATGKSDGGGFAIFYVLYSDDYGETYVNTSYVDYRGKPKISGNGSVMLVSTKNTLYKSTNGVDWAPIFVTGPSDYSFGYEISYDGQIIFYSFRNESDGTDNLLLSEDGGTNWVSIAPADTSYKQMPSCAITNDGTKAVMYLLNDAGDAGALYSYNVTTNTFTNIDSEVGSSTYKEVAMSGDGETIMVSEWTNDPEGDDGELYISTDAGVSWYELYPTNSDVHNWYQMALSNDGNVKLVSYRDDDGVYQLYLLNGEQVCEETFVGEPYDLLTVGSYLVEETDDDVLFTVLVSGDFDEFVTVTINGTDGMPLDSLPYPYLGGVNYNDYFHTLTFDMGDIVAYSKVNGDLMASSLATSAEIIGLISSEDSYVMGFYPTSYGVILIGIYNDVPAFMGYAFQKSYSSSLSGVLIENISIFNNEEGVRNIDLTSGDANTTDLVIGCTGFTCSISFSDIENAEAKGYLRNGENVYLNPYFISLNPRDANANIFNRSATIRLALPPDATTPWIVRADGFYGTREDILRYGTNIGPATILEDSIGRYVEFDIDGWSSYTLGYIKKGGDDDEDMFFDYESEMCIGETYAINVWDKFDDPIKNALVTIHYPDGDSMESRTKLEGNILFTPQLEGVYRLDAQGPSGYDDIKLSANYQFTARDCSLFDVCPDPTKENYILVVDNPPFDCQYACSITECSEGMDLVDDSLGCRCALLICPDPEENYRFVINDPPTCTYECAIDQAYCDTLGEGYTFNSGSCTCELGDLEEVELIVVPEYRPDPEQFILKDGEVCTGGAFTFDVISSSADFLLNAMVSVFDENGVKIYENVDLSELQPLYSNGTYTFVVSSPGYKTSRLSVEIVDCPEPDIEEPIITPVESSFWDDIINILRTSIKGGCEGFYFEGIPTILCDLVWVVVIVGSIGAAYLEPLKSRKVISLFTPSVVAIILIPLMGAIAAAVVVYLAYNSKKHVEGKLGHEKEQMEEEIKK